jgi:Protein of unknown function (DUF4240)
MKFLNKLFNTVKNIAQIDNNVTNSSSGQFTKVIEVLEENLFWLIIDKSLSNSSNQDGQEDFLIKELENLTAQQIIGFHLRIEKFLYDIYNSEMWCASHIMNGGSSDDGFEYFRSWVISRGKKIFYDAKQNPDSLVQEVDINLGVYEFESFYNTAFEAFENKTGKSLYDYLENKNLTSNIEKYAKLEFTWQEEDAESMKKICPELFKKLSSV